MLHSKKLQRVVKNQKKALKYAIHAGKNKKPASKIKKNDWKLKKMIEKYKKTKKTYAAKLTEKC